MCEWIAYMDAITRMRHLSRKGLAGGGEVCYNKTKSSREGGERMRTLATIALSFAAGGTMTEATPLTLAAVFCMILGFGAKAGLFPLHNWLPSAHPAAPAPASALLSGLIAKAGVIAVLRTIFFTAGAGLLRGTWVQTVCLILVLISIFMGSFMGCLEKELKKRLAYSSISQISYVLLGLFILSPDGFTGSMLQLFFHAAAKIAIFQCAGSIILLAHKTRVDELRGLGRRMPVTFICFALVSLSLVGIPPFGGFHSKWYLATAALEALPGALPRPRKLGAIPHALTEHKLS